MFKKIVVPLDGSKLSEGVLPRVRALAKATGAEVVLLRVVEPRLYAGGVYALPTGVRRMSEQEATAAATAYLVDRAKSLAAEGIPAGGTAVVSDNVADAIIAWTAEHEADLIALTSHGLGRAARWVFGSVAETLLQRSSVPILVVRATRELLEQQEEEEESALDEAALQAMHAENASANC